MPRAKRTILWRTKHDPRVFVDKLDFVTASGNVDRVVTPLCVFRRIDGRLVVESRHEWVPPDELVAATGFKIDLTKQTPVTPPPSDEELRILRAIDPGNVALTGGRPRTSVFKP